MCVLCTAQVLVAEVSDQIIGQLNIDEGQEDRVIDHVLDCFEQAGIAVAGNKLAIFVMAHEGQDIESFKEGLVKGFVAAFWAAQSNFPITQKGVGLC